MDRNVGAGESEAESSRSRRKKVRLDFDQAPTPPREMSQCDPNRTQRGEQNSPKLLVHTDSVGI
jgi:hypothetical protein